ncbi:MAG: DNA repair protein RecO [Deltaproteobacteria bacterium]|nr:MAG: DNA repair protein RecO [Deltaproteobacteria bacterium]
MPPLISSAIILRHVDYGEADRIVTVLTPDHGRLKGFARGARRSRKRFGTALEPFAEVRLHWVPRPGGELVSLREAELVSLRTGLRRDLETLALAGYGCELTEALFDEAVGFAEAFGLLRAFLDHLDAAGASAGARLLMELRLLTLAGIVPHLQHCAECHGALPEGPVGFDAGRGGSLCPGCGGAAAGLRVDRLTLGSLGRLLQTPLERFADIRLSPRTLQEGGALLADALRGHLPKPLKSAAFLAGL